MMCKRKCEEASLTGEKGNGGRRAVFKKKKNRWKEYNETPESLEGHSNKFGLEPYALNLSLWLP